MQMKRNGPHACSRFCSVHSQDHSPAVQQTNSLISVQDPNASAAPQLLSTSEKLPQAGQKDGQQDQELLQPGKLGKGDSKKDQAEDCDGGPPAASQQDEGLVRVAHLGQGALLNDWPLLVRVMHPLRAPRNSNHHSGLSSHEEPHNGQPAGRPQGSADREEGMRAGPSRWGGVDNAADAMGVILSGAQYMCQIAPLPDGGVGLVPSAAFLRSWALHTTLHSHRLQAPQDGSSDDSAESSDESTSGSTGSCNETGESQDAGAYMEAAEGSFKTRPCNDTAASRDVDGSSKKDRPCKPRKKKKLRKGMLMTTSLPLLKQSY